jgi:hypothetical protein
LLRHGAHPTLDDGRGVTPLLRAREAGHSHVVELLKMVMRERALD